MPKIKQVLLTKQNLIKAIALEDFVNPETGILVKRLSESGLYDKPGTIPTTSDDLSWIFKGAIVKKSTIRNGTGVTGKSYLDGCTVESALVNNTDLRNSVLNKGKYENSILKYCKTSNCEINNCLFFGDRDNPENNSFANVKAVDSSVHTSIAVIASSQINHCKIGGTNISVVNSKLLNAELFSNMRILDSTLSFEDLGEDALFSEFVHFESLKKDMAIRSAYVQNTNDILVFKSNGESFCLFLRKNNKDYYIDSDNALVSAKEGIKKLSQKRSGFLSSWSRDILNIESFLENEFSKINEVVPMSSDEAPVVKNILMRDIFEVLFSDEHKALRDMFKNKFSVNIFNKEIQDPRNFVFYSNRMYCFFKKSRGEYASSSIAEKIRQQNTVVWI